MGRGAWPLMLFAHDAAASEADDRCHAHPWQVEQHVLC
ncbi:hypothetical protein AAW51_0643 [Caldimonas brevitalea]|uniref:Uncharacterized protein n=1 Tax=Caldimonas brevitalea TaxID=413882 RepID=A0A0G3BD83_9BURK|nr:hypothetical protein AAW51_0643 [Caldimonas brevitalea]